MINIITLKQKSTKYTFSIYKQPTIKLRHLREEVAHEKSHRVEARCT